MPSVLFINRVYPPEEGATGQLLAELAEALAKEGWNVTVLATGKTGGERTAQRGTVTACRVRGFPFTRASLLRRALSYASLYPALFWRALRLPRHDIIVTLTDPPLLLVLGPWLRLFKRSRLVHWAQDIYPEIAEELGVLRKGGLAAKILRSLSARAMRRHNQVIVVGRCMKARLQARGMDEARLTVIPNWAVGFADFSTPHPSPLTPHPLTVLYSGNFGLAHPFESIIEAVRILERGSAPVRFVFAGAGPRLNSLRQQLAACRNVEFRAPVPLAQLPASLAGADVHLACMSEELLGLVVPSKIYGAMATRPCIFLGPPESEAARALQESRRGVVLSARDSGQPLAELLAAWSEGDSSFDAMRTACQSGTASHFSLPLAAFHRALHP